MKKSIFKFIILLQLLILNSFIISAPIQSASNMQSEGHAKSTDKPLIPKWWNN